MKKALGFVAAIFMFCALMVGPASQAHAAGGENQDGLAMALASMLGLDGTSSAAAFAALAAVGIQPVGGWVAGGEVTAAVMAQVQSAITAAVAAGKISGVTTESLAMYEGGIVAAALGGTKPLDKPATVSPANP